MKQRERRQFRKGRDGPRTTQSCNQTTIQTLFGGASDPRCVLTRAACEPVPGVARQEAGAISPPKGRDHVRPLRLEVKDLGAQTPKTPLLPWSSAPRCRSCDRLEEEPPAGTQPPREKTPFRPRRRRAELYSREKGLRTTPPWACKHWAERPAPLAYSIASRNERDGGDKKTLGTTEDLAT